MRIAVQWYTVRHQGNFVFPTRSAACGGQSACAWKPLRQNGFSWPVFLLTSNLFSENQATDQSRVVDASARDDLESSVGGLHPDEVCLIFAWRCTNILASHPGLVFYQLLFVDRLSEPTTLSAGCFQSPASPLMCMHVELSTT
jgi:hypothetical protein